VPGLWGLQFGYGNALNGPRNYLFFSSGPSPVSITDQVHQYGAGLFGVITPPALPKVGLPGAGSSVVGSHLKLCQLMRARAVAGATSLDVESDELSPKSASPQTNGALAATTP
jgi:hypothetical protein